MSHPDQASIICKHVMQDFANAQYVTRQGQSWGAACSKQCLETSGPATASMVGLDCFSEIPDLPRDYHTLPSGFAYQHSINGWSLNYDLDEFEPEEGEFIAAPTDHAVRKLRPNDIVFTLMLSDGGYAILTLDEGTRCVPFWLEKNLPEEMLRLLDGSEQLMAVDYSKIEVFARERGIRFLAPNFLSQPHDLAILVPDTEA